MCPMPIDGRRHNANAWRLIRATRLARDPKSRLWRQVKVSNAIAILVKQWYHNRQRMGRRYTGLLRTYHTTLQPTTKGQGVGTRRFLTSRNADHNAYKTVTSDPKTPARSHCDDEHPGAHSRTVRRPGATSSPQQRRHRRRARPEALLFFHATSQFQAILELLQPSSRHPTPSHSPSTLSHAHSGRGRARTGDRGAINRCRRDRLGEEGPMVRGRRCAFAAGTHAPIDLDGVPTWTGVSREKVPTDLVLGTRRSCSA
ncbi:hypothetical protein C8Q70DRAFT_144606 [Cubamyces menziesii]|nr:hypothetical protein C8Q70DRAFT_144606 [Cubamyces menziesii]